MPPRPRSSLPAPPSPGRAHRPTLASSLLTLVLPLPISLDLPQPHGIPRGWNLPPCPTSSEEPQDPEDGPVGNPAVSFLPVGRSGLWGGLHALPLLRWSSPTAGSKMPGAARPGLWGSKCVQLSHGHGPRWPGLQVGHPNSLGLCGATCRDRV